MRCRFLPILKISRKVEGILFKREIALFPAMKTEGSPYLQEKSDRNDISISC